MTAERGGGTQGSTDRLTCAAPVTAATRSSSSFYRPHTHGTEQEHQNKTCTHIWRAQEATHLSSSPTAHTRARTHTCTCSRMAWSAEVAFCTSAGSEGGDMETEVDESGARNGDTGSRLHTTRHFTCKRSSPASLEQAHTAERLLDERAVPPARHRLDHLLQMVNVSHQLTARALHSHVHAHQCARPNTAEFQTCQTADLEDVNMPWLRARRQMKQSHSSRGETACGRACRMSGVPMNTVASRS
jgi:hypothetical protein